MRSAGLVAAVVAVLACLTLRPSAPPLPARGIALERRADGTLTLSARGDALTLGPRFIETSGGRFALPSAGVDERIEPTPRGVELKWRFEGAPGDGAVALTWSTSLPGNDDGDGARAGPFSFSVATWVDSSGLRERLPLRAAPGGLRVDLPADLLARTRFPAELDPLVRVRPVDAPVIGAVGAQFESVSARGTSGALTVVAHQRAVECHLYDDDGGLRFVRQLPVGSLQVTSVTPSGGQMLLGSSQGYLRVSDDCTQVLGQFAAVGSSETALGVNGGWALLANVVTDAGGDLIGFTADLDGGLTAPASLGRVGNFFQATTVGDAVVLAQTPDFPNATPLRVRWFRPSDWVVTSDTMIPNTAMNVPTQVVSVPGQVMVVLGQNPMLVRRFDADGGLLDSSDVPLGVWTVVFAGDTRYVLADGYRTALMTTDLSQSAPTPWLPDAGYGVCSQLVWGPKPLCGSDWPGALGTAVRWYDATLSAFSGVYRPATRSNAQLLVGFVQTPGPGYVVWFDDREASTRLFAAPLELDGTLDPGVPILDAHLESETAVGPAGQGLIAVAWDLQTAGVFALDGGALVNVFPPQHVPFPGLLTSLALVGDTVFAGSWRGNAGCPFEADLTRLTLDAGRFDFAALGCSDDVFFPLAASDAGVWVPLVKTVDLPDGGFDLLGEVTFTPVDGPTVVVHSGSHLQSGVQPLIPLDDGACFATTTPFAIECVYLDGGVTDRPLPGPGFIAFDGQRFQVSLCLDGGSGQGALEADGGASWSLATEPCAPILAVGPGHLAWATWSELTDAGLDDVTRVYVNDYFVRAQAAPCAASTECSSGYCVDGVCCDSACGFSADDCQACGADGVCRSAATCGPARLSVGCGCESAAPNALLLAMLGLRRLRARRTPPHAGRGRPRA